PLVDLAGDRGHVGQRCAFLGQRARDLLHEQGGPDLAPSGRGQRVLDVQVVVDHDLDDLDALVVGELGGQLEVEDVAGVVLHDVQDAGAAVHRLGGGQHLVGHRGGEHLPRGGRVQHAVADEAAVQRLVPGPAAGDQPDLARPRGVAADHYLVVG